MSKKDYKNGIIGVLASILVILLLMLAGPVSAVKVNLNEINNGFLGDNVDFSFDVNIRDSDLLPIKDIEVVISGPNGFTKLCNLNLDGTDDCDDVDFSVSNNANALEGQQAGLDEGSGDSYDLGYGYGFSDGDILVGGVWRTSENLDIGDYVVSVSVNSEGSLGSKAFKSDNKGFSLNVLEELSNWNKEIDIFEYGTNKKIGKAQLKQTQTVNLVGPFRTPLLVLDGQVLVSINELNDLGDREIYEGWLVDENSDYKLSLGSFKTINERGNLYFDFKGYFDAYDKVVITEESFPDSDPSSSGVIVGVGEI